MLNPALKMWKHVFSYFSGGRGGKSTINTLGRWSVLDCEKKTRRRIDWTNHDHCGPCGKTQVHVTKKMFDKYID